ncbi:class I SAM-dependent methyltransferase [Streptomyces sp. NPDC101227]|uniref:class I SAM-dependent methyltransferase n=1 Tax=Streptomyces sp. NPDC101227 TaxID=3366136 RepID=UPI00380E38F6
MEAVSASPSFCQSFGEVAALYDRYRPRYAEAALKWALGTDSLHVADLAAGTGIVTRQLVELGHHCTAVEPDSQMRAYFRQATTGVQILPGSGEDIPLQDSSVDAVVVGEAYHWFDTGRAHPEIARVLKPGGAVVLMWNVKDEGEPWVAALTAILSRYDGTEKGEVSDPVLEPMFMPAVRRLFPHAVTRTLAALINFYRTHSYYITAKASQQVALEREIERLIRSRVCREEHASFEMPYHTLVYRAHLS